MHLRPLPPDRLLAAEDRSFAVQLHCVAVYGGFASGEGSVENGRAQAIRRDSAMPAELVKLPVEEVQIVVAPLAAAVPMARDTESSLFVAAAQASGAVLLPVQVDRDRPRLGLPDLRDQPIMIADDVLAFPTVKRIPNGACTRLLVGRRCHAHEVRPRRAGDVQLTTPHRPRPPAGALRPHEDRNAGHVFVVSREAVADVPAVLKVSMNARRLRASQA